MVKQDSLYDDIYILPTYTLSWTKVLTLQFSRMFIIEINYGKPNISQHIDFNVAGVEFNRAR